MSPSGRSSHALLLRAPIVLPVSRPPIHNGAVRIQAGRIMAVGTWRELSSAGRRAAVELDDCALLPGLVNAHCHLDYTRMAGQFPPPKGFTDWLKVITSTKAGWNLSDYADSWSAGAQMLLESGVTTVGDIEAVPELLPTAWKDTPLRVLSFFEMISITNRRTPGAVLNEVLDRITALGHWKIQPGLSPHAPYSTRPELLSLSARAARRRRLRLCVHVAESAVEFEMFAHGRGEMFDWMRRSGRDMSDCGQVTPVRHLQRCGALNDQLLATHVNYLGRGDISLIANCGAHVVHCPRSHTYFRHAPFPLRSLLRAGVNVCLGTDSLASVYKTRRQVVTLSLLDEMRELASRQPWLSPRRILAMGTINGARALGLGGKVGELAPGAFADLVALPLGGARSHPHAAVLAHHGKIAASMIDGKWVIAPACAPRDAGT